MEQGTAWLLLMPIISPRFTLQPPCVGYFRGAPHMLHGDKSSSGGGDGTGIGGDATAIRYAPYHVPLLAPRYLPSLIKRLG